MTGIRLVSLEDRSAAISCGGAEVKSCEVNSIYIYLKTIQSGHHYIWRGSVSDTVLDEARLSYRSGSGWVTRPAQYPVLRGRRLQQAPKDVIQSKNQNVGVRKKRG
jgi:hypothetical protein